MFHGRFFPGESVASVGPGPLSWASSWCLPELSNTSSHQSVRSCAAQLLNVLNVLHGMKGFSDQMSSGNLGIAKQLSFRTVSEP